MTTEDEIIQMTLIIQERDKTINTLTSTLFDVEKELREAKQSLHAYRITNAEQVGRIEELRNCLKTLRQPL